MQSQQLQLKLQCKTLNGTQAKMEIEQAKAKFSVDKMKGEAAIKAELMQLGLTFKCK